MFNRQRKTYTVYKPQITVDSYNQEKVEYEEENTVSLSLSLNGRANYSGNDMSILQCEYVGVTNDNLEVGDLLDMKYEVRFIQEGRRENYIFLKEYENHGRN